MSTSPEPSVSIVIPTRDRPHLLSRAVASALGQTTPDIEVIVVDDGSVQPINLPHTDERVRLVRNEQPSGLCAARNRGIDAALGTWMTFLDDDDWLAPHMVATCLRAARESRLPPPVAVVSGVEAVDDDGERIDVYLPKSLPRGKHYFAERKGISRRVANTLFVPREILLAIGGWDPEIPAMEQTDLFIRLNEQCSIQGVPVVTYCMSDHGGQHLRRNWPAAAAGMKRTLDKNAALLSHHRRFRAKYRGAMGLTYLRAGQWRQAIGATTRAMMEDPRQTKLFIWWLASLAGPRVRSIVRRKRLSP
jgi:glycosyltransferase involved in cell wall biosynthesis